MQSLLERVEHAVRPLARDGRVARYIPALAKVDPSHFGLAVATLDGEIYATGAADQSFSIQSISKVFALALALRLRDETLWDRVGRLPSSNQFNSLIELELEGGKPRNPFLNPGALAVSDMLYSRNTQMEMAVLALLRDLSCNPALQYDMEVARGEFAFAHRNLAAAHLMKSFGNFCNPVEDVVKAYCAQCAIAASCKDLAVAALFLANGGLDLQMRKVLEARQAQQVCALMMSSGTYEASGETAFSIGLPIKSGVGGGVLAVIPRFGAVCSWSPPLDEKGNSVAGLKAIELVAGELERTVFS